MIEIEKKFIEYLDSLHQDFVKKLKQERQLTPELEGQLMEIIESFIKSAS
jgi:F0F1-type ATP synthase alpha subunit